jgi:hypothetical protein
VELIGGEIGRRLVDRHRGQRRLRDP